MITIDLKIKYESTKDVIFNVLLNIYAYRQKIAMLSETFKSGTRYTMIQEMAALRSLFHCIVLQLCILDDDSSDCSFQKIKNDINKSSLTQKKKDSIGKCVKEYREVLTLSKLKIEHRNNYIAHMNSDSFPDVTLLPDYDKGLKLVVEKMIYTFNMLWGSNSTFILKVGSQEKEINLIEESK